MRLLMFIILGWIASKFYRSLFSISKSSKEIHPENSPLKSRHNMDIQDAEFEDME